MWDPHQRCSTKNSPFEMFIVNTYVTYYNMPLFELNLYIFFLGGYLLIGVTSNNRKTSDQPIT